MTLPLDHGSQKAADRPWHTMAPDDVLSALSATPDGLTTDEARTRLARHGPNVLDKKGGASVMALIWGQIKNPLIWVLIGSAVIAMLVDPADGIKNGLVILAVVIINTIIGFAQEYKASKAIESLSAMVPEFARQPMNALTSLKQLHYLVALSETLNFTRAAESCFVTQSIRLITASPWATR